MGDRIERNDFPQGRLIGGESRVGYVFENREFYAPKVVYELQRKGIRVSATNRPFQFKNEEGEWTMGYGTYQVLTHNQPLPSDVLYATLGELAKNTGVDIYSANTGLMADVDFGSPAFKPLEQPKVAMLVGRGVSIPESGEIWFLLDKRFQMRPVLIENPSLTGKDLKAYNVIILANGVPNLTKGTETALKEWVAAGGVLIATGKASAWASKQGLISLKTKETLLEKADSLSVYRSFADKAEAKAGKLIKGVILNCHLDKTHPLAWGLDQDEIAVIKTNDIIFQKDRDPYVSPLYYTKKPLLSGFLSADNANLLREEPAIMVKPYRSGKVIVFADDMNFRSYFFGTSKLFMNALFYNKCSCRMSTQRNILCLMALVLSGAMEFANACTSAIISGKVTPDGRPIMWKNRDAENLKNCVRSHLSRSFHNPLMGIDLKDGKHNKPETSGWFAEQDFIARRSTSCAVAIQGVRPDEDASFTTMWTVIGYPPVTPAVPVWLKGADKKLPKALTVDQNKHAPLCDASNMLRDKIYSYHRGTNTESYFHWELLFNLSGNGYMQQTEQLEEELFERFYSSIETWRSRSVIPEELVFNLYDDCDAFLDEKTLR